MQTWFILVITYALFHALVAVLDRQVLKDKRIRVLPLSTVRFAINAIMAYVFVLALRGTEAIALNYEVFILSVLYFLAAGTYFYAIKMGDVSKLIPYRDAIVVLLSFFLAVILLEEEFFARDFLGVLTIMAGGYIVWTDGKLTMPKKTMALVLIAASATFVSLNGIAAKSFVVSINPLVLSFMMYFLVALYFIATTAAFQCKESFETFKIILSDKKHTFFVILACLFAVSGTAMMFFALSMQNATKVLPFSGTIPLFAALIGGLALKEKHGIARVIGAAIILAGIYILQM